VVVGGTGPRTFATAIGKRDSLRLADGVRVILGPASQLIVAADYGQHVREVELHGEAYFDVVQHHASVRGPRRQRDRSGRRYDLHRPKRRRGTRAGGRDVGSVSLLFRRAWTVALLGAGDVGTTRADGRVAAQRGAYTSPYLAWMRDSLVFREAPIAEVSSDLRRWYGVVLRGRRRRARRRHLTMTSPAIPSIASSGVIGLQSAPRSSATRQRHRASFEPERATAMIFQVPARADGKSPTPRSPRHRSFHWRPLRARRAVCATPSVRELRRWPAPLDRLVSLHNRDLALRARSTAL
jgi:hypothetical protein